ncbi:LysE family translocator [Psychroflexus montanilacus]|uniref:LysE family translocator n=1 Tax=Psychroflexus montanilacus TaxID=2873598 RepID=UPI001CCDC14D|nr:LysE family transporter [Psychroflexus montanilacus]MBZ9652443.1 LysE family transporter [Psychroflexus montanilacus]
MEDLQIYIYTFLAAFVGVIPPGLVNMSVAKTCLEKGRRNGVFMAFGASLVVFFQALLAVLISKYIFSNPQVKSMFLKAGVGILILMFIYFLLSANRKKNQQNIKRRTGTKSFFTGILVSVLNIFPIPYFVLIGTLLSNNFQIKFTIYNDLIFAFSAAMGTLTTLYLYVIFIMKIDGKTELFKKYSNYFMAMLMLVLIVVTWIRLYNM